MVMAHPASELEAGLRRGVAEVLDSEELVALLDQRSKGELFEAGRRAVQLAVSPLIWEERLGAMLDTVHVCERLGVSRQAVAKAVDASRLVGIRSGKSRRFPVWQFTFGDKVAIRPQVGEIMAALPRCLSRRHPAPSRILGDDRSARAGRIDARTVA